MKRTLQNDSNYDKYDKIDMLWKKIGKVPKPPIQRTETLPSERFETSLELELINEQTNIKNSQKGQQQKNSQQKVNSKQNQSKDDEEEQKKISFIDTLIKLSVSTYNIETTQESHKYLKDQACKPCLQRFQQIIKKLKQQIKLFVLDYKIFKQQIKLEIKSYWYQVQELIKKISPGSMTSWKKFDEKVLKIELEQKRTTQDKLYYIEMERMTRKKSIIRLEQQLAKVKEQSQLLQRSYFDIKISHLSQIPKILYKGASKNALESKNFLAQKSEKLRHSSRSRNEERVGQNKKSEDGEEMQSIKKKLNGLKMRLNKTYSIIN